MGVLDPGPMCFTCLEKRISKVVSNSARNGFERLIESLSKEKTVGRDLMKKVPPPRLNKIIVLNCISSFNGTYTMIEKS